MKVNRLFSLFLVIGIIFSSIFVFHRGNIENGYKNVEITLDYDQLLKMKEESDKNLEYFLKEFKSMGVNSVSVNEATLNSLKDRKEFNIKTSLEGYNLVVSSNENIFDFIVDGFTKKLGQDKVHIIDDNTLKIDGTRKDYIYDTTKLYDMNGKYVGKDKISEGSKLEYLGIGFLKDDLDIIRKSGLNVIARPIYLSQYEDEKSIKNYFDFLDKENIKPNFIIFSGGEVLGYDKDLNYLKDELKNRNIVIGMIETSVQREHIDQKGLKALVEDSGYYATRVFNIWNWIQIRYDYEIPLHKHGEEIINSMYRAVTERNVRIIYFKPFIDKQGKYVTDMDIYKQRFSEFEKRIEKGHNLKLGKVNPMKEVHTNKFMNISIVIGVIASLFILIDNIFNINDKVMKILFLLGIIGTSLVYILGIKVDLLDKAFALLGSITMPSLSMVFILYVVKEILKLKTDLKVSNIIFKGILTLVFACIISFIGVLFETSLLFDSKFLLEMDIFRGVKMSQIMPILFTVLIYISIFGYKRSEDKKGIYIDDIVKLFKEDIKVGHVIVLGIFVVGGIIFIARTGHETNIKPSTMELLFRNMLEMILTARPRNKAFLMAHPALILMVYLAFKDQKWMVFPLSLAVVIGQSNMVNTFSHLRAPLYLSYARTNYEIIFGVVLGGIAITIIDFIWRKLEGRKRNA
ncbi:DUF5693 family protein [Tepidibacter formicigenes]|jgi:hypothetical protein|uniref:Uncharacterized protein n=1 Tax=Tepidibacter formicigenes DSM 15518 TaxID=1123349 RepID=A0A1M6MS53_9FIRM|nr:DUF5693 family protein [Tepidibacter formicigenes]SHJ86236.1 hypothetical protein SAMN02744037_01040 [Tepidibacter formicigenes DSM 15518]